MSIDRKKYLSLDVIGKLEEDLEANPLDRAKWMKLITQVLAKDKEEQVRKVMNNYLGIFKFDGDQWCVYINYEIDRSEFKNVEELFRRCLAVTNHVGLYRLYVLYVRRVNDVITGGETARRTVITAFEFAIKSVGIDLLSSELWEDYLDFLRSWTPAATWEQQQKNDLIRKVFKQYLQIPTEKLEKMWPVYTNWENEVNPITAKKFINERSKAYSTARLWFIEWSNLTERQLQRTIVPHRLEEEPHLIAKQKLLWYRWIELEEKNQLELKDDLLQQRIEYVFRQAVATLPFVPELWFKCNKFWLLQNEEGNLNKCIELLSEGLMLNPKSFLLTFQLSEMYEQDNSATKATETFNGLIEALLRDHKDTMAKIASIVNAAKAAAPVARKTDANAGVDNDEDDDDYSPQEPMLNKLSQADVTQLTRLEGARAKINQAITFVYTKLMISAKRVGGIKEARAVFKTAKNDKFKSIGYDFYVNNALLEYYSDNKKTANRIFELGMKVFSKSGGFLLKYLDYLIMINDVENIRVLFEQGLTSLLKEITSETEGVDDVLNASTTTPAKKLSPYEDYSQKRKDADIAEKREYIKELFKKFSKFETKFGDLNAVKGLEKRYEQYFPLDNTLDLFCDRYHDEGALDAIREFDLGMKSGPNPNKRRRTDPSSAPSGGAAAGLPKTPSGGASSGQNSRTRLPEAPREGVRAPVVNSTPDNSYHPQVQGQQFVGNTTYNLLRTLPSAQYFGSTKDQVFSPAKLVELFSNMQNLPGELPQ